MVGLMALMALTIDGGLLQRQRRIVQLAADAAAKAAAIEIYRDRTDSIIASAVSEATRNGFTNGVNGHAVTVTWPSTEPGFSGNQYVQVLVRDSVRSIFAGVFGRARTPVTARAVGGVTGTTQSCVTALDPNSKDALIVQSQGHLDVDGCKIAVNSTDPQAACVTSGGAITGTTSISVAGQYDSKCDALGANVTLSQNQTPVADPLQSVTLLATDTTSQDVSACIGGVYDEHQFTLTSNTTLNPSVGAGGVGAYCGGITAAKSGVMVTLNPGIYVIRGGGFNISAGGSIQGNGVAIINLDPPTGTPVNKFGPINIAGDGSINLTAMSTGTLAGIVFYTPRCRADVCNGAIPPLNRIHSSTTAVITGSMYFPDQRLEVGSGNGPNTSLTINGGIIGGKINFAADSYIHVLGFAGGSPYGVRQASLVK
jgi:Predicted membrane protein (DUF2134).